MIFNKIINRSPQLLDFRLRWGILILAPPKTVLVKTFISSVNCSAFILIKETMQLKKAKPPPYTEANTFITHIEIK